MRNTAIHRIDTLELANAQIPTIARSAKNIESQPTIEQPSSYLILDRIVGHRQVCCPCDTNGRYKWLIGY